MLSQSAIKPKREAVRSRHPGPDGSGATFRPPSSLTEQIADHLTREIIIGRLPAGQRIGEQGVAQALGVSRGSVREALLIVERRHLIDIVPRRGAVVSPLTQRQLDDLFDLDESLYRMIGQQMARLWDDDDGPVFLCQLESIRRAADDRDVTAYCDASERFLGVALALVRNRHLDTVIDTLRSLNRRALHGLVELDPTLLDAGADGWRTFFEAMASGEPDQVTEAVSAGFDRHREVLLRCGPSMR